MAPPLSNRGGAVSTHSRPKAAGIIGNQRITSEQCFNTQPPEGGWLWLHEWQVGLLWFQHTAARRRLASAFRILIFMRGVSTHSRPKAAGMMCFLIQYTALVSTHSRPKAAGRVFPRCLDLGTGFNTQPPEGGWLESEGYIADESGFNTQPPEGGWALPVVVRPYTDCFNTQPPEGGWGCQGGGTVQFHGFNTQPPEGGWLNFRLSNPSIWQFQHTAARRRLGLRSIAGVAISRFQHTAARRRLALVLVLRLLPLPVSTHSRPKAAGLTFVLPK